MDVFVFSVVLFAAACHAGWNSILKIGLDPLRMMTLISLGSGIVGLLLMPVFGTPAPASWPYAAASVVIHLFYFAALIETYRTADLSQVYPIARGAAPLMTAIAVPFYVGETLNAAAWAGVLILIAGVFLLSMRGGRDLARIDRRSLFYALLTAFWVAAYSVVDGVGGRLSGNVPAYSIWVFSGTAVLMLPYALWHAGPGILREIQPHWWRGGLGGSMQLFGYGIAIWAMTVAPIAIVAALRETSVLFGAILAVVWLKEKLYATRIVAALLVLAGLVLIRLA